MAVTGYNPGLRQNTPQAPAGGGASSYIPSGSATGGTMDLLPLIQLILQNQKPGETDPVEEILGGRGMLTEFVPQYGIDPIPGTRFEGPDHGIRNLPYPMDPGGEGLGALDEDWSNLANEFETSRFGSPGGLDSEFYGDFGLDEMNLGDLSRPDFPVYSSEALNSGLFNATGVSSF